MDCGAQPLDEILTRLGLANTDLVNASTGQLTYKVVQKGRKGRRLTRNAQIKILNALNAASPEEKFSVGDLFNYS